MRKTSKIIVLAMLVMMIACVSAVSATDIESSDDVSDIMEVDEVTDVVEDVEIDDATEDVVEECSQSATNPITVNSSTYSNYFDANGYFNDPTIDKVTFDGSFGAQTYGNFKFNQSIIVTATAGSTFTDVGFDLLASNITLKGVKININAPENTTFYAINVDNAANSNVLNNVITYVCAYDNAANYNYVIRSVNSEKVTIYNNTINATLPLKTVSWSYGLVADYVLGVGIQNCEKVNFTRNTVAIVGNKRVGSFPTLDAVMIVGCNNAYVEHNDVSIDDTITGLNEYSYIYGIDVYSCNNITINNNTVDMNGNKSGGQIGVNGTGAAYCIQLTGPHNGVVISNNHLTTVNNGPNLGIYSQNYFGGTQLTIYGNTINVTGKAGGNEWALVSGMELQDSNATVYNNTVRVNNTNAYTAGNYAFGISYCQATEGDHYFDIHNNNVEVINGDMAVSLRVDSTGAVKNNTLKTTNYSGNDAVSAPRDKVTVRGNV